MEQNLEITFETLRVHYGTGRSFLIRKDGRRSIHGYRRGVMTDLGDLELEQWRRLAEELIQSSKEQQLYQNLLEWKQEHNYTRCSMAELATDTLELHMARIFDDPLWVDYVPFNRRYRPEVLNSTRLVLVKTECCEKYGQTTQEQLDEADRCGRGTSCPICGRWSAYRVCDDSEVLERGDGDA